MVSCVILNCMIVFNPFTPVLAVTSRAKTLPQFPVPAMTSRKKACEDNCLSYPPRRLFVSPIIVLLLYPGCQRFFFSLGAIELSGEDASREAARKKTSGTNG